MDEARLVKPEHIIRRVRMRKNIPESEVEEAKERLREKVADVPPPGEEGHIEFEMQGHRVSIEYGRNPTGISRLITRFTIEKGGEKFDIMSLVPEHKVVWQFTDEREGGTASPPGTIKRIAVFGNFARPTTLLALFHEIGHAVDFSRMERLGRTDFLEGEDSTGVAEELRAERAANAFALKNLKPLLDRQQRKDVITVIEHDALKSYYDNAAEVLEKIEKSGV